MTRWREPLKQLVPLVEFNFDSPLGQTTALLELPELLATPHPPTTRQVRASARGHVSLRPASSACLAPAKFLIGSRNDRLRPRDIGNVADYRTVSVKRGDSFSTAQCDQPRWQSVAARRIFYRLGVDNCLEIKITFPTVPYMDLPVFSFFNPFRGNQRIAAKGASHAEARTTCGYHRRHGNLRAIVPRQANAIMKVDLAASLFSLFSLTPAFADPRGMKQV
jgi:hypothetical protein